MTQNRRLIDADALEFAKFTVTQESEYARGWNDALAAARRNVPTVDAVEVTRCKDCKYLYDGLDDYCCTSHRGLVRICEGSFCSYGERRKNG